MNRTVSFENELVPLNGRIAGECVRFQAADVRLDSRKNSEEDGGGNTKQSWMVVFRVAYIVRIILFLFNVYNLAYWPQYLSLLRHTQPPYCHIGGITKSFQKAVLR